MAFINPAPLPTGGSATRGSCTRTTPATPKHSTSSRSRPRSTSLRASASASAPRPSRPRTSAPVIDLRVATRLEAHHWISVRAESRRVFERAAVAQADVTGQLEKRTEGGALHRWVLRETAASPTTTTSSSSSVARYIVMESFARAQPPQQAPQQSPVDTFRGLTRRWLSAVERVGPLIDAAETRTLHYENVFTAKRHDVTFDPHSNLVVLESHAVADEAASGVLEALRAAAEASVASGRCLEFCVLRSAKDKRLFKTVQVYRDADAMKEQTRRLESGFMHAVRSHSANTEPSRTVFKPVMFA